MRGPKPPAVNLTDEERQGLEQLVDGIVHLSNWPCAAGCAAADGKNNAQIAGSWA